MPSDRTPVVGNGYAGPSPTTESLLWLSMCGKGMRSAWLAKQLIANGLPLVVNTRVNGFGGWSDGCVWLDMRLRHVGGGDEFKSVRIPVEACLAHDTATVLKRALAGISMRSISLIESTLLSETSLRHVSG